MSVDVSKAVCQQLMESSTATLTSVLRLHGLKNTFMHGVAPLGPGMKMAGPAFTLRYIPAREDLDEIPMDNLKDVQRVGIEQVPDGAVFPKHLSTKSNLSLCWLQFGSTGKLSDT